MSNELDYNKIASELIQANITKLFSSVTETGDSVIKTIQNKLKISYSKYLKSCINKYSKTKTVLYRDKPVRLYDFYEHVNLKHGKQIVNTNSIANLISLDNKLIITGTAGSGKSTLLKHLFLSSLEHKQGIPIFIELRNLNNVQTTLEDYIYDTIYSLGFVLEKKYFLQSLSAGGLIIFLDGYDELRSELRPTVTQQIFDLESKYLKNIFIVSSRPDDEFVSWNEFTELRTQPLSKEQAYRLIERLNYDESVKKNFLVQLKQQLYDKHRDFLSIPLLLTIMLMTYGQNADIPSKMHIFYSQVFDTLFNKHDATKAVYHRKMYTDLAIDDFKTILSAFSILSYSKHLTTFTYDDTISILSQSKKITGIKFKEEPFLKDLLKSVCILSQEGLVYSFTHRTFQEFFAAIYIYQAESTVQDKLLKALDWEIQGDKVLLMLFEMQPSLIERKLIIPKLKSFFPKFCPSGKVSDLNRFQLFKHLFSAIYYSNKEGLEGWGINNSLDYKFCRCIATFYPQFLQFNPWTTTTLNNKFKTYLNKIKTETPNIVDQSEDPRLDISEIEFDSELASIILSEPTRHLQYLDHMALVLPYLEKKHSERAKSIEAILFQG